MILNMVDSTGALVSEMHEALLKAFMRTFQKRYFRAMPEVADLVVVQMEGPSSYQAEGNKIQIHPAVAPFPKLARIVILSALIHCKLHKENGDQDVAEGPRFQNEIKKLLESGAYKGLL
ncbi:MAG TPA: hypothetical protein VKW06_19215 [Candidatus Angelobacter sp.]|nr:hypothetical protein [Candidatus Angelobacter sp.]